MSQDNLELVRDAFEAFSRNDMDGVLGLCDEGIVVTQPPEVPGISPQQHGHRGVLEAFEIWPEQWDDFRIEILRENAAGDHVVVTARTSGRGKQSGVDVEMDFSFLFTVRDEKIVEMKIFIREEQALEAAGLDE
jgi:ketosteroid isomerase-like protein